LPENATVKLGSTKQLQITKMPSTAIPDGDITWKSSNPNVATVDSNGNVSAIAEGEAIITAKLDGLTASCKVKVVDLPFILGDVNEDGTIDTEDAVMILKHLAGNITLGDVNEDGTIATEDAVMILKHLAGNITLSRTQMQAADTSKDGSIDTEDAVRILKKLAGNITEI